ncbi:hypothetical protein SDC9_167334 [bioreactor metagenome]|uniref:Uncharacterized protein n=1 Tax=bioreactor metagenome TaxID=1076179 RepID=A0A645G2C1_9ZZZZ
MNCNTAGTIGTLHVGYAGNIKECRLNLLSGTIDKAALGSVSAEGLTCDKMILNLRGGDITTQFDLIDTKPFTFGEAIAYVADGIKYTATAGEGITLKTGNLPATVSLDKTSYKPGQAITVSFTDASAKDWVGIIKKGHTPGETAIDNDMGGKTFGSALMWAYISGEGQVVLTAESEGCLKDLEKIELPVGDYILFYAQNDSYAVTQSIEFKVSNETAPTETGDMTYILIAAIILSAIAAAVVVKKQRS